MIFIIISVIQIFINKRYYEGENIILKETIYRPCENLNWGAIEIDKRIKSFRVFDFRIKSGIFSIKGNNGTALFVQPPESEYNLLYLRSDIVLPELEPGNFSRAEIVQECYPLIEHTECYDGTTDKEIINELIDIIIVGKKRYSQEIPGGTFSDKTLLLYSDTITGCALHISIHEFGNLYFLQLKDEEKENDIKFIEIPKELLENIFIQLGMSEGEGGELAQTQTWGRRFCLDLKNASRCHKIHASR